MTTVIEKRDLNNLMWLGVIVFVILHGLDVGISHMGINSGAKEIGLFYGGSMTLQMVIIKLSSALLVGCVLMRYMVGVKIKKWLALSSDSLFKGLVVGQLLIVCFVAVSLLVQINGGVW